MRRIFYFLEEAGIHLRENKAASTMTTLTIAFSMLIFGLFLLLYLNLSALMESLQSEIRILLYLREGISSSEVARIRDRLESEPEISEIEYISEEQALEDFRQSLKGSELLLKGLGQSPLPSSFELTMGRIYRSSEAMARLAERLRGIRGIEEIQYGREWIENIEGWLWLFRVGAMGVGGLLAFTVVAIMANTIQLTLSVRKDEVELLRLIGATKGFIGIPFVLEGAFIGLLSSGLALFLLVGLFHSIRPSLLSSRGPLSVGGGLFFLPMPWVMGLLVMGVGLGCVGSYWAFRRWI